jgi:ComF family protein
MGKRILAQGGEGQSGKRPRRCQLVRSRTKRGISYADGRVFLLFAGSGPRQAGPMRLSARLHRHRQRLGRLLLPPRCLVCALSGVDGLDLCRFCREELPWNRDACPRCALPLPPAGDCARCLHAPPPYTRAQAAFEYRFPLDRLLPRFKFHGDLAAGALLATLLHWSLDPEARPQALLPVPLHRARLRQRGYDQALELAKALARESGLPLFARRLRRQRRTQAQTRLGAAARRGNVLGAFTLAPGPPLPAHVALVDDVLTTGATAGECAQLLLAAGVERVDVWTVAVAPAPEASAA